ncbi:MAG: acyl-CoA dehydrogenase [Solirubrobacterales bacterium]|nr:acyl-CoA dehydrogenase [Solirubrobacterales bacterium]
MNPPAAPPADLDEFRAAARAWLAGADVPDPPEDYDERFAALRDWQRTLYEAGWIGFGWPEEFGGRGLTAAHQIVFSEELARARAPQPVGLIGLDVVGPTILGHGTDEQRRRLLPPLLSGEELWSQGFSEPSAGSDLASLRTKGVVEGEEIVITGQKVWTSWAEESDWCAVLARTDPDAPNHKGISYVLVPMDSPGIEVRPIVQMTGDAEFNEVFFDGVRVPVGNLLGGFGAGWKLAMDTLGHERGRYALRRRMENETSFVDLVAGLREHAAATGGNAVADRAAVQLGELYAELRAYECQARATVERIVAGDVPSPLDSIDKLTLSVTEQHLYALAVELLGPARMAADATANGLPAGHWLRGHLYARSGSVYGGSAQIQRSIVAERMLDLPRSR